MIFLFYELVHNSKDNEQLWYYISQLTASLLVHVESKYMNTKDAVFDENIWFLKYKGVNDFFLWESFF